MRTTLDIDPNILEVVKTRAKAKATTAGAELSALARQGLEQSDRRPVPSPSGRFLIFPADGHSLTDKTVAELLEDW